MHKEIYVVTGWADYIETIKGREVQIKSEGSQLVMGALINFQEINDEVLTTNNYVAVYKHFRP